MFLNLMDFLLKYWVIVLAVASGIFFFYKIKAEETLRIKMTLMRECYKTFAEINDAIQTWANPMGKYEEKETALLSKMQTLLPKALDAFHAATLLMRPETIREMNKIFVQFSLVWVEYGNWKMFKEAGSQNTSLLQNAFNNSRKHLPEEIEKTLRNILTDFQIILHGRIKIILWKFTGCWIVKLDRNCFASNHIELMEKDREKIITTLNNP